MAELILLSGRNQPNFSTLIYKWLNDMFEAVETDPEKVWFLDKTVQFSVSPTDVGPNGLAIVVPNDCVHVYSMFIVDATVSAEYREIKPISDRDARKHYTPNDNGTPRRFSNEGRTLRFWPSTPDQAYNIEMSYKRKLVRVSATADTNSFMQNYHNVLMSGLQARAWEYLRLFEEADRYWAQWNAKWADMRAASVAKTLAGEITLVPLSDANADTEQKRGGQNLTWGGN